MILSFRQVCADSTAQADRSHITREILCPSFSWLSGAFRGALTACLPVS